MGIMFDKEGCNLHKLPKLNTCNRCHKAITMSQKVEITVLYNIEGFECVKRTLDEMMKKKNVLEVQN